MKKTEPTLIRLCFLLSFQQLYNLPSHLANCIVYAMLEGLKAIEVRQVDIRLSDFDVMQ
jgi:hypothetical protein